MNYESNEDKGKLEIRNIKAEMAQARQLVSDMEHTNRTIAEPTKRELVKKISVHRETVATLGKDLALAEQKFDSKSLFGSRSAAPLEYDKSQSARDRATQATEKLRGGTSILEDAHRRVEETIDVGADTLSNLEENRNKMNRIRGNVRSPPSPRCTRRHTHPVVSHCTFFVTGWGGLRHVGYSTQNFAWNEQTGNPEQDRGGFVCSGNDWRDFYSRVVHEPPQIIIIMLYM